MAGPRSYTKKSSWVGDVRRDSGAVVALIFFNSTIRLILGPAKLKVVRKKKGDNTNKVFSTWQH